MWPFEKRAISAKCLSYAQFRKDWFWLRKQSQFWFSPPPVAVIHVNVAHLRAINESRGFPYGNRVLKLVRNQLVIQFSRWGGQAYHGVSGEFYVLIHHASALEWESRIQSIHQEIEAELTRLLPELSSPLKLFMGYSIGSVLSQLPAEAESVSLQLRQQIAGLRVGNANMVNVAPSHKLQDLELLQAVVSVCQSKTQPVLAYQPIVDLIDSTQQSYVEVLSRLKKPNGPGNYSPDEFFPIVAFRHLQAEFDHAVIRALKTDLESKHVPDGIGISLNLSGPGLLHPTSVRLLECLYKAAGDRKMILEVTETDLILNLAQASAVLSKLKELGYVIALDDFGTGYSGLTHLVNLPIDIIKLDRSLVQVLTDADTTTGRVLSHMLPALSKSGYLLVAEGIETELQQDQIKQVGFHYGQGYFWGKPLRDIDASI